MKSQKPRRFKLTYHGESKRWLVTDRYREPSDPCYYQTFKFSESAFAWIELNTIKPEDRKVA